MDRFRDHRVGGVFSGLPLAAALLMVALMLAACAAGGSYGRLIGTRGAYDDMRSWPIGSDYAYYKTPSTALPNAIIAIHKNYSLKTSAWTAIAAGGRQPPSWRVYSGPMGLSPKLLEIQGPNGEHIGLWYSIWTSTVVKLLENNEVQVFPPDTESGAARRDRG